MMSIQNNGNQNQALLLIFILLNIFLVIMFNPSSYTSPNSLIIINFLLNVSGQLFYSTYCKTNKIKIDQPPSQRANLILAAYISKVIILVTTKSS